MLLQIRSIDKDTRSLNDQQFAKRKYRYELVTRYVFAEIRCLIGALFIANGRSYDHVVIVATNRSFR